MRLNVAGILNACKATAKTYSTMDKKIFIPLYDKHLHFLIKRCGWLVTKFYLDFTFDQAMFKKYFVVMNQISRQNAKTSVEKDFYKLMNNSNFSYNCRNDIDNRFFSPIVDEIEEVRYIRRHQNIFDPSFQNFVSCDLLERDINNEFDNEIAGLDFNCQFFDAKRNSLEIERKKKLDAISSTGSKKKKAS